MNTSCSVKPSQTPIIFLHGWGMNKHVWRDVVDNLPADVASNVTCLNLPGYGTNKVVLDKYDLNHLVSWLDQHITEPSIIVGWSLGGLLGQAYSTNKPEKVVRLLNVATSPKFMAEDNWQGIKPDVLEMFLSQLQNDHQIVIERFMAIQAMGSKTARQDIKLLKERVLSEATPTAEELSAGLTILQDTDLRNELTTSEVDSRYAFGRLDSLVPQAVIEKIAALNPNFTVDVFAHASHAPFISHNDEFMTWLIANLR